jgi:glycerate kinase
LLFDPSALESMVVSDVKNPLFGKQGAAHVFAPQKGATESDVAILDEGLEKLAALIDRDLGIRVSDLPGAGAAGGLGAGGVAFLRAGIQSGIATMIRTTGLPAHLKDADLVITGEGMLDHQSLQGKVIAGVAELAQKQGIPCVCIVGNTSLHETDYQYLDIRRVLTVMEPGLSLEQAIREAGPRVERLAAQLVGEFFS